MWLKDQAASRRIGDRRIGGSDPVRSDIAPHCLYPPTFNGWSTE